MYESFILRTVVRIMLPLLLVLSLFVLMRGHDGPGAGVAGGLLGAAAMLLHSIIAGPAETRRILPASYIALAMFGLLFAIIWGSISVIAGLSYMHALWTDQVLPGLGSIGTPIFFNIGIYITIFSATTQIGLLIAEEFLPVEHTPPRSSQDTP